MRKPGPLPTIPLFAGAFAGVLGAVVGAVVVTSLPGCGGGGDGGGPDLPAAGTVALLLADAPAVECDELWITVTEATLLPRPGGEPVVLYDSAKGIRVNILEFADEDFVFVVRDDVPAGRYAKIRLAISKVEVVGGPCESVVTQLPSGHLDVTPRGPFDVEPGRTLSVRLDLDANKSINLHPADGSRKCIFRPVAFCEIEKSAPLRRCPHVVRGTVVDLDVGGDGGATIGFELDLLGSRGTIDVVLAADAAIFDESAAPVGPDAIDVGDRVSVRGRLDDGGRILALAVLIGDPFVIRGTIAESISGGFSLDPVEGKETLGIIRVEVTDGTLIYTGCDTPVGPEALREGAEVWVAGHSEGELLLPFGEPLRLRAAVVQVRHVPLAGDVTAIRAASGGHGFTLAPEEGPGPGPGPGPLDVFLPPGGALRLGGEGEIPPSFVAGLLRCRNLTAAVRLEPTAAGDRALEVILGREEVSGSVVSVAAHSRLVNVGGTMVQLREAARILDVSTGPPVFVPLSSVRPGNVVRAFGLEACAGGAVGFIGFTLLIEERG